MTVTGPGIRVRDEYGTAGVRTGSVSKRACDEAGTRWAGPPSRTPRGTYQALPRIRLTVVPQTGHLPFAMRMPVFVSAMSPSKSRFSLHLTQ